MPVSSQITVEGWEKAWQPTSQKKIKNSIERLTSVSEQCPESWSTDTPRVRYNWTDILYIYIYCYLVIILGWRTTLKAKSNGLGVQWHAPANSSSSDMPLSGIRIFSGKAGGKIRLPWWKTFSLFIHRFLQMNDTDVWAVSLGTMLHPEYGEVLSGVVFYNHRNVFNALFVFWKHELYFLSLWLQHLNPVFYVVQDRVGYGQSICQAFSM